MVGFLNKGPPHKAPIYVDSAYANPQKGTPNFGNYAYAIATVPDPCERPCIHPSEPQEFRTFQHVRRSWTPKVCNIMAFMAIIMGLGLLFYILLGFRICLHIAFGMQQEPKILGRNAAEGHIPWGIYKL